MTVFLRLECSKLKAICKAIFTSIAVSTRGLVTWCDSTTNVSGQQHPSEEELDAQFASFGDVNDYMSDDEEWVEEQEDRSDSSSTDNTNEAEAQGADVDDFAALQSDILSEAAHSVSDFAQPSTRNVPSPLKVLIATPSSLGSKPSSHSQTASSPSSVLATCSDVTTGQTAVLAEASAAEGLPLDTPDGSSTSSSDTQPEHAAGAKSDTSLSLSPTSVLARQQVQKSTAPPSNVQPELQPSGSEGMHIAQLSPPEATFEVAKQLEVKELPLLHLDARALESQQRAQQTDHEASQLRLPAMLFPEGPPCDPRPSAAASPLAQPAVVNAK